MIRLGLEDLRVMCHLGRGRFRSDRMIDGHEEYIIVEYYPTMFYIKLLDEDHSVNFIVDRHKGIVKKYNNELEKEKIGLLGQSK